MGEKKIVANVGEFDQAHLRRDYVRVVLLMQDVEGSADRFDELIKSEKMAEALRELKIGFLAYYLIADSKSALCLYGKGDEKVAELWRELSVRVEFLNRIRNLISGHLDERVLDKLVHWAPDIFSKKIVGTDAQLVLVNKYLLDVGLSVCAASDKSKREFLKHNVDLTYPPDYEDFLEFMRTSFALAMEYLSEIKSKILSRLKLYESDEEVFSQMKSAAAVDFKL